jgi:uncharacterized protein DUF3846
MKIEIGFLYRVGADLVEEVRPTNGKKFSLAELQKLVGGYIEYVPGSRPIAYCKEEGRLTNLPPNALASLKFNQVLVGDVIQVRKETK